MSQLVTDMRAQRYHEVERRARELLVQHPNSGIVWKFLGVSLGMQGKEALHALEKTATLLPDDAESHFNLGNAMRVAGRLEDAEGCYRRALSIRPDFAIAHVALGGVVGSRGQLDAAVVNYRRALEIDPDLADAHGNLGSALNDLGQPDAATASFRKALEIAPDVAETHSNLGNVLLQLGRPHEAVAHLRRALEIKPDFAAAHTNLGNALRGLGQFDDAVASHRRALEIQPDFAAAGINFGNALRDLGQYDAATASYRRVLEIEPHFAVAHCNLGGALRDLGRIGDAEACFRQALAVNPDYAEAHSNLGVVLRLQNRMVEAEASCRNAREIAPDLPAAIVLLAELQADKGQFAEAEELFKRAIAIEPDSAEAWAGIAGLRKMTANDSAWLTEAQRIASQRLPPRQEVHLRYAIGKYFDDVHDYAQAFANYRRANELTKLCTAKHDRRHLAQAVSLTVQHYDRQWMSQARGAATASARPVFIVGMPRSGTSLAEQILASHPAVFGAGELAFWSQASANYESSTLDVGSRERLIGRLGLDYLRQLEDLSPGAVRVVDKMPANFLFLGLIHAALPNARIIHMRRNPIDTCLSAYFQNFDLAHSYANDFEDLAHYYNEYLRLMKHWNSLLPKHAMMEVPYEGLVANQEAWSRKMVEFVGLPWDSRCIGFNQTNRAVVTRSRWQVRQIIDKSSVERWRNYEPFIGPLLRLKELDNGVGRSEVC
ncbi:MAG TPA: tetratricopeptide repeat protein [Steroidobacteraceae bacterium]